MKVVELFCDKCKTTVNDDNVGAVKMREIDDYARYDVRQLQWPEEFDYHLCLECWEDEL